MAQRLASLRLPAHYGPRAYARLFRKLVADTLWRYKGRAALMVGSGLVGVAFQGAAMGVAIGYAQFLQQDRTVEFAGRTFVARESIELLVVAGLAAAAFLVVAAVLSFWSQRMVLRLRLTYEEFCTTRGFQLLGLSDGLRFEHVTLSDDEKAVGRLVKKDARFLGRAVSMLAKGIVPLATLFVAAVVLFYLSPLATIVLGAVMLVSAPWLYRVNQQAAMASRDREETGDTSRREYRHVTRWLSRSPFKLSDPEGMSSSFLALDSVRASRDSYGRFLLTAQKAELVSGLASALALLVLVVALGSESLHSGAGFAELLAYLMVLVRALASFRTVNKAVSSLNRFQPQMKRYFAFLDEATEEHEVLPATSAALPRPVVQVHARPGAITSTREHVDVEASRLVALVAPVSLTRYTLPRLVRALLWKDPSEAPSVLAGSSFVTSSYGHLPGRPLYESIGLGPDVDADSLRATLSALGVGQYASTNGHVQLELFRPADEVVAETMPALSDPLETVDETVTDLVWKGLGDDAKFAFALLAAERSDADWVFIDEKSLRALDRPVRRRMLDRLADRGIFVVHPPRGPRVGAFGEEVVVALDREGVLGVGNVEWFRSNPAVADAVAAAGKTPGEGDEGMLDEEEEDEDLE